MQLDRFDVQILELMQQDAGMTASDIAASVPLSASAIQRRVRRMRQKGVIERDIAVVNPARVGDPVTCMVSVHLTSERPELVERYREWLRRAPFIQQVYFVTGDSDYILVVSSPSMGAFDAFMSDMVAANANVKRFTTNVVLNALKRGLAIPVSAA